MKRSNAACWGPVLTLLMLLSVGPLDAQADTRQGSSGLRVELKAGAIHSTSWIEAKLEEPWLQPGDTTRLQLSPARLAPGITPFLGIGVGYPLSPEVSLDFQAGYARGTASGSGPGGSWEGDDFSVVHGTLGVRFEPVQGFHGRVGLGKVVHSASDMVLFQDGDGSGLLMSGGVGYRLPVGLPLAVGMDFHRYRFGTPAFRSVGGIDGPVQRILLSATWTLRGDR